VPQFDRSIHPPLSWPPAALQQFNIQILIKRRNRWYVELSYLPDENLTEKRGLPPLKGYRVFDVQLKREIAAENDALPAGEVVRLDEGHEIELELGVGKQTERSPVFKP
jgi:hypothetical protein